MTQAEPAHPVRYHSLDALRAVAMILGIVLHVEMAYMTSVWDVWPVDDTASTPVADFTFWVIHLFRMQVFFLMAGFFACMLYARYGVKRFALHRLKRIGLPLAIGMITIVPIWRLTYVYGLRIRYPEEYAETPLFAMFIGSYMDPFNGLHPAHLWFLEHLLVMYALAIGWLWLAGRASPVARVNALIARAAGHMIRLRLFTPLLTLAPLPLLYAQSSFGVDTQSGNLPPWNIVLYYTVFFSAGWMLFHNRQHLDRLADLWYVQLALGLGLIVVLDPGSASGLNDAGPGAYPFTTYLLSAFITALLVVGSTGMFLRLFHRQSAVMRYVSDSAYWLYLAHLPVVVIANIIVLDWQAPALVKLGVTLVGSSVFLFLTYQLCIRHTPIGLLLNGRMGGARPPSPHATVAPANGAPMSHNGD